MVAKSVARSLIGRESWSKIRFYYAPRGKGGTYVGILRYLVKNYFISKRHSCFLYALNATLNHTPYDIVGVLL